MLEGGVKVSLFRELDHLLEMLVVDVCVHTKQSLQDRLGDVFKVFWKWYTCNERQGGGNMYEHVVNRSHVSDL